MMRMIDVLQKLSEGEIKNGTILTVKSNIGAISRYKCVDNCFLNDYHLPLNIYGESDLNREVTIIEPKPKKYQLKLYADDDFSYVTRSSYDSGFNYDIGDKNEICEFITKFTQEEIDNAKLLKFVEQHGIKEEVEDQ